MEGQRHDFYIFVGSTTAKAIYADSLNNALASLKNSGLKESIRFVGSFNAEEYLEQRPRGDPKIQFLANMKLLIAEMVKDKQTQKTLESIINKLENQYVHAQPEAEPVLRPGDRSRQHESEQSPDDETARSRAKKHRQVCRSKQTAGSKAKGNRRGGKGVQRKVERG